VGTPNLTKVKSSFSEVASESQATKDEMFWGLLLLMLMARQRIRNKDGDRGKHDGAIGSQGTG